MGQSASRELQIMASLETYFKGLADLTRLRIMNLLQAGELCGADIQLVLESPQSNVSRHLTYLKRCELVLDRREGYRVYYRLAEGGGPEAEALLDFLEGAFNEQIFVDDQKRLAKAVKEGECSITELEEDIIPARTGLENYYSRG
jgi:ArsR family transcriptional regulator, arsenate/arsenite/antimonite-responsive transcriptional repressor